MFKNYYLKEKKKYNLIFYFFFLFLGILIRILLLDKQGTIDLGYWSNFFIVLKKFNNLSYLYYPGFQNIEDWKLFNLPAMYPPGFIYILFFFSKIDSIAYLDPKILVKIIFLLFEFLLFTFLFFKLRKKKISIFLLFWINPLIILSTTCLGYTESMFIFFLVVSLIFLNEKKFFLGILFFVASCSVKQLSLVLAPLYFCYYVANVPFKKNFQYLIIILFLIITGCLPIIFSANEFTYYETALGFCKNMYWGIFQTYISANGLNAWWIYTSVLDVISNSQSGIELNEIVKNLDFKFLKSTESNWSFENFLSRVFIFFVTIINGYLIIKIKDCIYFFKIIFFQYFCYIALSTGTHENHAVLLAYLSSFLFLFDKNFLKIAIIINIYTFLNLWMFYGFDGNGNILREYFLWQVSSLLLSAFIVVLFIYLYLNFVKNAFKKIKY